MLGSLGCWFGVFFCCLVGFLFRFDLGHLAGEFLCVRLSHVCCPGLNLAVREVQRQNKDIARLIISRACESLILFYSNCGEEPWLKNLGFKVFCTYLRLMGKL